MIRTLLLVLFIFCVPAFAQLSSIELVGTELRSDDLPDIAAARDGTLWLIWMSYSDRRDEINLRQYKDGEWSNVLLVPGAIETNGTLAVPEGIDWICVSPKAGAPLKQREGDEIKLVYPQIDLPPDCLSALRFSHFFLQPKDGIEVAYNTARAIEYCLAGRNRDLPSPLAGLVNVGGRLGSRCASPQDMQSSRLRDWWGCSGSLLGT